MSKYEELSRQQDYEQWRYLIRHMRPTHAVYKLLRDELKRRGNWKERPRGIGFKSGDDPRRLNLKPDIQKKP